MFNLLNVTFHNHTLKCPKSLGEVRIFYAVISTHHSICRQWIIKVANGRVLCVVKVDFILHFCFWFCCSKEGEGISLKDICKCRTASEVSSQLNIFQYEDHIQFEKKPKLLLFITLLHPCATSQLKKLSTVTIRSHVGISAYKWGI